MIFPLRPPFVKEFAAFTPSFTVPQEKAGILLCPSGGHISTWHSKQGHHFGSCQAWCVVSYWVCPRLNTSKGHAYTWTIIYMWGNLFLKVAWEASCFGLAHFTTTQTKFLFTLIQAVAQAVFLQLHIWSIHIYFCVTLCIPFILDLPKLLISSDF